MAIFHEELGIEFIEYDEQNEYAKIRMPLKKEYANPINSMHGGLTAALTDTVAGLVASAGREITPTNNMNLYYFSPIEVIEGEYVYADAKVIKRGKKIIVVESNVYDKDDNLAAKATFSFSVISLKGREDLLENIKDSLPIVNK